MEPLTLEYSTPQVFFSGAFRWRSSNGVIGVAVLSALTVLTAVAAFRFDAFGRISYIIFGLLSVTFLAGATTTVWGMINGHEDSVRVTEDGIEYNRRLLPWQEISFFGGRGDAGGVILECHIGRGRMGSVEYVSTTPKLTAEQFAALIRVLSDYLASEFPHVEVVEDPYKLRS